MQQERLNLYFMDMKYVRDLHKADDRVQSVSPQIHKNNRPFVGIVVICDEHKYCIPLDSAKEKHKTQKNDVDNKSRVRQTNIAPFSSGYHQDIL